MRRTLFRRLGGHQVANRAQVARFTDELQVDRRYRRSKLPRTGLYASIAAEHGQCLSNAIAEVNLLPFFANVDERCNRNRIRSVARPENVEARQSPIQWGLVRLRKRFIRRGSDVVAA